MRIQNIIKTVAAVGALALASVAQAGSIVYSFDSSEAFSGGPWGTVTLTDSINAGQVDILVDLIDGFHFVDTGTHEYFSFNTGGVSVVLSPGATFLDPISTAFKLISNPGTNSPFSSFQYGIVCDGTCSGGSDAKGNQLQFSVVGSGLSIQSFANKSTGNGTAAYFAADIITGANTGAVGSNCVINSTCTSVPEPATLGLLGLGLAGVGFARRRKIAA